MGVDVEATSALRILQPVDAGRGFRRAGPRGRPRKRGDRLPAPGKIAQQVKDIEWQRRTVMMRGVPLERLIYTREVLWYGVCPNATVLLIIVRDPDGKEPDDFFFTTQWEKEDDGTSTLTEFSNRWAIEVMFRDTKQYLGGEDPQSAKKEGRERAAAFSFFVYGVVWAWYLKVVGSNPVWKGQPWYDKKATPSFGDALALLRRGIWAHRFREERLLEQTSTKMVEVLLEVLASAC